MPPLPHDEACGAIEHNTCVEVVSTTDGADLEEPVIAIAAIEEIGATTAETRVSSGTSVDHVRAVAGVHGIVTTAGRNEIVTWTRVDHRRDTDSIPSVHSDVITPRAGIDLDTIQRRGLDRVKHAPA